MDGTLAIVLLVLCLGLLVGEVFIPSGGLILVTALVCLAGSVWLGWRAWSETPTIFWAFIASVVVVVPLAIGGMLYWFPRTTMGKRILLDGPTLDEVTGYNEEATRLKSLVGKRGKSLTLMNPGGLVLVEGERHHSESQGLLIEPNEPIEVVGVSGTRIVVRLISEAELDLAENRKESQATSDESRPTVATAESSEDPFPEDQPVDFEFPRS